MLNECEVLSRSLCITFVKIHVKLPRRKNYTFHLNVSFDATLRQNGMKPISLDIRHH